MKVVVYLLLFVAMNTWVSCATKKNLYKRQRLERKAITQADMLRREIAQSITILAEHPDTIILDTEILYPWCGNAWLESHIPVYFETKLDAAPYLGLTQKNNRCPIVPKSSVDSLLALSCKNNIPLMDSLYRKYTRLLLLCIRKKKKRFELSEGYTFQQKRMIITKIFYYSHKKWKYKITHLQNIFPN